MTTDTRNIYEPNGAWTANTTRLWGIALHPQGEEAIVDFVINLTTKEDFNAFQLRVFTRNKMAIQQSRIFLGIFCMMPALLGMLSGLLFGIAIFSNTINCRIMVWYIGYAITVSIMCNKGEDGCVIHYPPFLPWYWFLAATPINTFFSAIFSRVAYQQYCVFGSEAWKHLARDGIQTMCLVTFCNVACAICILVEVVGKLSELFFVADW
ncbi:hypothetical protein BDF19DRAFT_430777 [Syncephalis fuscata]|nr:hypothetical protein BDF19DRAFT_430777 [Syncephalis fuscata]